MNDVLALAARTLAQNPPPANAPPAPTSGTSPTTEEGAPASPLSTMSALTALTQAVKIARDARDDADLARAEELMRAARQEMEKGCSGSGGPLCQSADQIRSLGY